MAILGIDLDNTIICYDGLFAELAREQQLLVEEMGQSKQAIRDALRRRGQEDRWTELQGLAYGQRIDAAVPFPGVIDLLRERKGLEWRIISHRSRYPYLGPAVDLHAAARQWLVAQGLVKAGQFERVFLEETKAAKLARIAELSCDIFIDDLPELLLDPAFPSRTRRVLFDPGNQNPDRPEYKRLTSWREIAEWLAESCAKG